MSWISYMFCFLMVGCLAVYIFTKTKYIQMAWAAIGTGFAFYASHPNAGVGQPAAAIIEMLGVIVFAWCLGTTIKQYVLKQKEQRDYINSTADVAEIKPFTVKELKTLPLRSWVWIEVVEPSDYEEKVSAYYRKHEDYTNEKTFYCGYPGLSFSFHYKDYGKAWLAFTYQPKNTQNNF